MTPQDLAAVLADMKNRHAELEKELSDPKIYSDRFRCRSLSRERGRLENFFHLYDDWSRALRELEENHELLQTEQDEELRQLISAEMESTTTTTPQYPDFGALLESVKESIRRMEESNKYYDRLKEERDARWEADRKEREEREAKWEKERKERDARLDKFLAESNARIDKNSADTRKAIKEMKDYFTTQWGRLVEALSKPAALALFKKEGIEIDRIYEEVHKAKVDGQDVMEIDVALCDTTTAVIVEVKSNCDSHDVDYFLSQMAHCKEWYKEFADKKLLVAVAAIDYAPGTETYARKKGLYVLKLSGEDTFTMTAPKKPLAF